MRSFIFPAALALTVGCANVEDDIGNVRESDPGSDSHLVVAQLDPWMQLTLTPPSATSMRPGWNKVGRITLTVDTKTTVRSIAFTQWHTDAANSGWHSCSSLATPDKYRLYKVSNIGIGNSEILTELAPTWSFLDNEEGPCDPDDYVGISIAGNIAVMIPEDGEQTFVMEYDSTGASRSRPDYLQVDIHYAEGFLWEADGGTYDGTSIEGLPVDGEYASFGY